MPFHFAEIWSAEDDEEAQLLQAILVGAVAFAYVLSYLGINYITGILVTLVVSYILLLKLRILTRSDIKIYSEFYRLTFQIQ